LLTLGRAPGIDLEQIEIKKTRTGRSPSTRFALLGAAYEAAPSAKVWQNSREQTPNAAYPKKVGSGVIDATRGP
jgi:hypothetical protein